MDPLREVAWAIHRRRQVTEELAELEQEFESLPWWKLWRRYSLPRELSDLGKELKDLGARVSDRQVRQLAERFAEELWREAARSVIPHKNHFGHAAKSNFQAILHETGKERHGLRLFFDQARYRLVNLPEVDAMVTEEFITRNTQRIMAKLSTVAASTTFGTRVKTRGKDLTVVIQHRASGLRAQFMMDGSLFGEVMSRSEHIESIDPAKPREADCERYAGLGIGQRLYEFAQSKYPNIRWRKGHLSVYAEPLRRRLHARDPYHWEGPCTWCEQVLPALDGKGWKDKDLSAFADHP